MVSVDAAAVRKYLNITDSEVPDANIEQFLQDWEGLVEDATGRDIDLSDCTKLESGALCRGAASDCIRYLAAGTHPGMSVNVGTMTLSRDGAFQLADKYKIDANQLIKKLPRKVDKYVYGVD